MNHDPIIFDPQQGCIFARFSLRRWFWGVLLSWSLSLINATEALSSKLDDFGSGLFIWAYESLALRNPLRGVLWQLGLWIHENAWLLLGAGNCGNDLFAMAYSRSGEELLDALNEAIPYEHLSPSMQLVHDNWEIYVTLCLPDRASPVTGSAT